MPSFSHKYAPILNLSQAFAQFYYIEEILAINKLPLYHPIYERQFGDFKNRVQKDHEIFCQKLADCILDYLTLACFGEVRYGWEEASRYIDGILSGRGDAHRQAIKYSPQILLPILDDLFNNQVWVEGYGGPSWGNIAKVALSYYNLPPRLFIDSVCNLVHNGGACYDKYILVTIDKTKQQQFLEFRRMNSLLSNYYNFGRIDPWLLSTLIEARRYGIIKSDLISEIKRNIQVDSIKFPPRVVWGNSDFDMPIYDREIGSNSTFVCDECGIKVRGEYRTIRKDDKLIRICYRCYLERKSLLYNCTICGYLCLAEDLMIYRRKHHGHTQEIYLCPKCKKLKKAHYPTFSKRGVRADKYKYGWLKAGAKIKYVSGNFGSSEENPLFGNGYWTFGIIKNILPREVGGLPILVEWNNGRTNSYNIEDLLPITKKDLKLIKAHQSEEKLQKEKTYKAKKYGNIEFQIGDKVKLLSGLYQDNDANPAWGGICGNIIGTIIKIYQPTPLPITVKWDNGETNIYKPHQLELVIDGYLGNTEDLPELTEDLIELVEEINVKKEEKEKEKIKKLKQKALKTEKKEGEKDVWVSVQTVSQR